MKSALALLLAGSALAAAFGIPSLAEMRGTSDAFTSSFAGAGDADHDVRLIKVSDDHDDEDNNEDDDDQRARHERDDEDHGDEDDEDDDRKTRARVSPAPAGTVAPPANGLFGNGAPPVAVTN